MIFKNFFINGDEFLFNFFFIEKVFNFNDFGTRMRGYIIANTHATLAP